MIRINKEKCMGCASCWEANGEIFKMDMDKKAEVRYQPCANMPEQVEDAVFIMQNCPNDAIEVL